MDRFRDRFMLLDDSEKKRLTLPPLEAARSIHRHQRRGDNAMCGCSTHQTQETQVVERDPAALTLRVEDMTCGHCAGTIKKAIETGLPGTQVDADPASKLVSVRGSTDLSSIKALVTEAGYTPTVA
jgi:copper chaperone